MSFKFLNNTAIKMQPTILGMTIWKYKLIISDKKVPILSDNNTIKICSKNKVSLVFNEETLLERLL